MQTYGLGFVQRGYVSHPSLLFMTWERKGYLNWHELWTDTSPRMIHTSFLRPSLINHVNMQRVDRDQLVDQSEWMPYPSHRDTRPSYMSLYFGEMCNLSMISRDISRNMFASRSSTLGPQHEQSRDELYQRLQRWHESLPEIFEWEKIPPHLMLLKSVLPHPALLRFIGSFRLISQPHEPG